MPIVKIKTIKNSQISCKYENDDTVRTLKQKIQDKQGIPVQQFKFIFNGQALDESKKVSEYKIEAGHILIMVPVSRGG